jgi:hypothetical protein
MVYVPALVAPMAFPVNETAPPITDSPSPVAKPVIVRVNPVNGDPL